MSKFILLVLLILLAWAVYSLFTKNDGCYQDSKGHWHSPDGKFIKR